MRWQRPTSIVLVTCKADSDYKDTYAELETEGYEDHEFAYRFDQKAQKFDTDLEVEFPKVALKRFLDHIPKGCVHLAS